MGVDEMSVLQHRVSGGFLDAKKTQCKGLGARCERSRECCSDMVCYAQKEFLIHNCTLP